MDELQKQFDKLTNKEKERFIIKNLKNVTNQYNILECLSIDIILQFINDLED